jgi:hypothetical protein
MRQTRALSTCFTTQFLKNSFQPLAISFQPARGRANNPGLPQEKS